MGVGCPGVGHRTPAPPCPQPLACVLLGAASDSTTHQSGGEGRGRAPPTRAVGGGGNAEVGWERNSGSSLREVLRQQKSDEETSPFTGGRTLAWPGRRERTRTALGTRTQQCRRLETQPGGVLFQPLFHQDWSLTCSPTPAPGAPPPNPGPTWRSPHSAPSTMIQRVWFLPIKGVGW